MAIWKMPNYIKYGFTYNKNKHGLCRPQCVLCGEILAAESTKLSKPSTDVQKPNTQAIKSVNHTSTVCAFTILSVFYGVHDNINDF